MKLPAAPRGSTGRIRSVGALLLLGSLVSCKRTGWDPPAQDRSGGELPVLSARRVPNGAIRLDGQLDEPSWKTAGDTGGFVDPITGRPKPRSRVKGSARVAWDDRYLYLALVVGDSDPVTPFRAEESARAGVWHAPGACLNAKHQFDVRQCAGGDPGAVGDDIRLSGCR